MTDSPRRSLQADAGVCLLLTLLFLLLYAPEVLGWKTLFEEDTPFFLGLRSKLYRLARGEPFTFWDEVPGLGAPRLGNVQVGYLSPAALPFYLLPTVRALNLFPVMALSVMAWSTYAFLRVTGLGRLASAFGTLSWLSMGIILEQVQEPAALETIGWLPLILLCWYRYLQTGRSGWAAVGALCIAGLVLGGYLQYMVYLGLLVAGCVAGSLWRLRSQPRQALIVGGAALCQAATGFMLSSFQLLPAMEMGAQCQRTLLSTDSLVEMARAAPSEVLTSLAAEWTLVHGPTRFGDTPYMVSPGLSLLVLGFSAYALARRRPRPWGLAAGAVFFLLGMLGNAGGVAPLLRTLIPPMSYIRAPVRMLVPAGFVLAWMAAIGMQAWLQASARRRPAAIAALAWSLFLMWTLNYQRLQTADPEQLQVPAAMSQAVPRLAWDYRTIPFHMTGLGTVVGVPTLVVYEPIVPRDYFEAIFSSQFGSLDQVRKVELASNSGNILPILKPDLPLLRAFNLSTMVRVAEGKVVSDPHAGLGRFFVVHKGRVAPSARERWALAAATDWDPTCEAIVEDPIPETPTTGTSLTVIEDRPDHQVLQVDGGGGLVITSGQFFPGWQVTVDGHSATPMRANLALRAVLVEAGSHRVEWTYRPTWMRLACLLTLVSPLLLLSLARFAGLDEVGRET